MTVLAFRRVVMMTSIDAGHMEGDLAERLLLIELHPLADGQRRTDAELTAAYADAQSSVFASLLDLTAAVLKRLPDARPESMPRMADFACVLQAVDDVKGWCTLAAYASAAETIAADVLEGEPFGKAIAAMVREQPEKEWTGTAGRLLEMVTPERPPKNWPRDATRAAGRLHHVAPLLRQAGISVSEAGREPQGNRSRLYALAVIPDTTSRESDTNPAPAAPAAPAAPGTLIDLHERAGAGAGAMETRALAAPADCPAAGAAGAGAGAGNDLAPGQSSSFEQGKHGPSGAAGATGAGMRSISEAAPDEWPDALPADWGERPA